MMIRNWPHAFTIVFLTLIGCATFAYLMHEIGLSDRALIEKKACKP